MSHQSFIASSSRNGRGVLLREPTSAQLLALKLMDLNARPRERPQPSAPRKFSWEG